MSWLFSQALVAEYLEANCLDGAPCAELSVMPTPHPFWHNGKPMESSQHSRFGQTSAVLTEQDGAALLMWFREGFRARTYPLPVNAKESTASDLACGRKWRESSVRFSLDSYSWKTAASLFDEDLPESWATLPEWGLMRDGVCWELILSERPTAAKERGSLLPTPSGCRSGKNHVTGRLDEWGGSSNPWRGTETGRTRSPSFEEWMMGWPIGWSALTALETARFQQWQQQHSESFPGNEEAA